MGHVLVKAAIGGRKEHVGVFLVDTGASFTVLPPDLAEKVLYEAPYTVELRLGNGRRVKANVFIGEVEIEGGEAP